MVLVFLLHYGGFPGDSVGKESFCNAGDQDSIPGWGKSPGEGNGNPLQYSCLENSMDRGAWWTTVHGVTKSQTLLSIWACIKKSKRAWNISQVLLQRRLLLLFWASLVVQLIRNLPATQETWVQSLGWEDSPGEGKGNPLQYSGLEKSMNCVYNPWGHKELDTTDRLSLSFTFFTIVYKETKSLMNIPKFCVLRTSLVLISKT